MTAENHSSPLAAFFDSYYADPTRSSPVIRRIWLEVYGDEYPTDVDPFSFTTLPELDTIARALQVGPSQRFADLGCGRGGPGLWVARATGADLVGVDFSSTAVQQATERVAAYGLVGRARFAVGEFLATGLETASLDGAMSIDAIHFAADKRAALVEVARILRPRARLVCTTWDFWRSPPDRPPQVDDHRPLLADTGFDVVAYDETPNWENRARTVLERMRAAYDELAAAHGAEAAQEIVTGAEQQLAIQAAMRRRVLIVAGRRT